MMFSTILAFTLWRSLPGMGQQMLTIKSEKPIICYQSFENRHDHVGLSEKFRTLRLNRTGRTKTANFEVEYINFPSDNLAKNAFEFAVEIWETELTSDVPIRIRADWRSLSSGVLGQALWGSAHANFGGEQHINTFYPVALAEKIAGREINLPGEPDIVASFNSNASWYFGIDGNTPSGKMDMVTIVLHEIAHGLGFTDTYDVDGSQGRVGLANGGSTVPFIFDIFVENSANKNLLQQFVSPSAALGTELQSSNIFFDSPLSVAALSGTRPELYAPSTFDAGSSISHLDEATFNGAQDANKLMTPHIAFAESIHNPGSVLMGILADIGWVYTRIEHDPLQDTERKNGQPYIVTARIDSDNGYDPASVKLHYTSDGINFTAVTMTPSGVPDQFTSSIPGTTLEKAYAYFISVDDDLNREFTSPGKMEAPGQTPEQGTHYFRIGPDHDAPVILHQPIQFIAETSTKLPIVAEVTDNLGVAEVVVEYWVNAGGIQTAIMQKVASTNEYRVDISLPALTFEDEVRYRLVATDLAEAENITTNPEDDFHVIDVTGILPAQDSYSNDFSMPTSDFFGNSFSISTPAGFLHPAIHSDHPYNNGSGPGDESHYVYQLQIPIRIGNGKPEIRFDEIVLVEPGENGSVFGDDDFFDYVVVEGSVDGGTSWKTFGPGYDSRANDAWLTRYNATIIDDNSQSPGDPSLFRPRVINMLSNGNFSPGNEVLVRFRLFADQFAHGWGWAIDNLSIQTSITGIEPPGKDGFHVYPVPASRELLIEIPNPSALPVSIQICDSMGRVLYADFIGDASGPVLRSIGVETFSPGIYIVNTKVGDQLFRGKFLKVNK